MRSVARAFFVLWVALAVPAIAWAQDDVSAPPSTAETEGARALFNQGIEAAAAGDFRTARDRFRAAERLRPAPAIELNLATALVNLHELSEAEELANGILANPESTDAIREGATALLERVRAEGTMLSVTVEGDATDVAFRLDQRPVDASRFRAPIVVAPGAHSIDATRDGETIANEEVEAAAGATTEVRLVLPPPVRTDVVEAQSTTPSTGGGGDDWIVWAAVGGGVALVVVAVLVIAVAAGGTEEPVAGTFQPGVLTW